MCTSAACYDPFVAPSGNPHVLYEIGRTIQIRFCRPFSQPPPVARLMKEDNNARRRMKLMSVICTPMTLKEQVLVFLEAELAEFHRVRMLREAADIRDDGLFKAAIDLIDNVRRDVADADEPLQTHYAHAIHRAQDEIRTWVNSADDSVKPELTYRADRIDQWLRDMGAIECEVRIQDLETGRHSMGRRWCFPDASP